MDAVRQGGGDVPRRQAGGRRERRGPRGQLKKLKDGTTARTRWASRRSSSAPNGGLILDIKSTYSTPADIAPSSKFLKGQGINVFGVGTFKPEQLDEIDADIRR